jgi:hypothetical protein
MISVVIQGPLNSRSYDCRNNILQIINEFKNIQSVDNIVISTWSKNDFIPENDKIIYIPNNAPNFYDNMNRYKQFYSIYKAASEIKIIGKSKYLLKIRTDQYISPIIVDYIINFYKSSDFNKKITNQNDYIISSHSYNCVPFFIGDFYFAGTVEDIILYTSAYVKQKNFCHQWLPEVDIVVKFMDVLKINTGLGIKKYLNIHTREDVSKMSLNKWYSIYTSRFSIFPKYIFETLKWRGLHFENNKHDYYEDWQTAKTNLTNYKKNKLHYYTEPSFKRRIKDIIVFFLRLINKKGI